MVLYCKKCQTAVLSNKDAARFYSNWEYKEGDPIVYYCENHWCEKQYLKQEGKENYKDYVPLNPETDCYELNDNIVGERVAEYKNQLFNEIYRGIQAMWIRVDCKSNTKIDVDSYNLTSNGKRRLVIFCPRIRKHVLRDDCLECHLSAGLGYSEGTIKCKYFHLENFKIYRKREVNY